MKPKLEKLMADHPSMGTYNIRGVYLGMEFVKDRETKEPAKAETHDIVNVCRDNGLLCQLNGYLGNRISFIPPINIEKEDVDELFEILDAAITEVEKKYGYIQ